MFSGAVERYTVLDLSHWVYVASLSDGSSACLHNTTEHEQAAGMTAGLLDAVLEGN